MTIHKQLAGMQQALKAPKSQRNEFANFNYRNCEDILEALKPLLGELTVIIGDDVIVIGDRIYVKATVTLSDGKDSIQSSAFAREPLTKKGMDEAQITGATSSYARKYALNGMFLIDDTKDADSQDNSSHVALTSIDQQWIAAIKSGTSLDAIEDPKYRAFIKSESKK